MSILHNISEKGILADFFCLLIVTSCKDDLPEPMDTSANFTVLKSIKIVNAGESGTTVLEGVVDEHRKIVSFPRIEPETDFTNLKFEAELSDGSVLDKEAYSVSFEEGVSEKTIVVKVVNAPRYREYLVNLRLKVPVFGADFALGKTYDYTSNPIGNPIYSVFTGAATRGTGFDGEHVLIVTRNAMGSHLLKVSDLKNNQTNPVLLNQTGVSQGTFTVNMGAQVNGHTNIANLSGNTAASPLKVYHWTDPAAAPEVIANYNVGAIAGAGVRHGDNFSVSLDDQGNGYMFFGDNAATKVLRLKVENYTTVSEPFVMAMPVTGAGSWTSYNRIGNTSDYIFTGHDAPIILLNEGATPAKTLPRTTIPIRASDARVIYFNGERYLIATTAARTGSEATNFLVYDITRGETVADALTIFEGLAERKPVFEYSLMGPVNTSPASQTGFHVVKDADGNDETLLLYSGASDTGFVIFEFPQKQAED